MKKIFTILLFALICLECRIELNAQITSNHKSEKASIQKGVIYIRFFDYFAGKNLIKDIIKKYNLSDAEIVLKREQWLINPDNYNQNKQPEILDSYDSKTRNIILAERVLQRTYKVYFDENIDPNALSNQLKAEYPSIEIAEPIYINYPLGKPNDPLVPNQTVLNQINAFEAWDKCQGDPNVIVAVGDNGIKKSHPDLKNHLAINANEIPNDGIDNDNNGYIDDYDGFNLAHAKDGKGWTFTDNTDNHGTNVAGIAAAHTNNSIGIAGIAYNCSFLPLKLAPYSSNSILYGYESILYAAARGVKVLNCSWGTVKPYSEIDQSYINYAISKDVVIVAAGGNIDFSIQADRYSLYLPGGYDGVLSVGEVDAYDRITTGNTCLSEGVNIMAPGYKNYTLSLYDDYEQVGEGTSFSAPVVSGAMGILRSCKPELNPYQAIEFMKVTSKQIASLNNEDPKLIPGRLDMKKMFEIDPMSVPGIAKKSVVFKSAGNIGKTRFSIGDTVICRINTKNYLGNGTNMKFVLSQAWDVGNSAGIVDSIVRVASYPSNEEKTLGDFKFYIRSDYPGKIILRVDVYDDNNYYGFFKFPFYNYPDLVTYENDLIKFSVADDGKFGYNYKRSQGQGFSVPNYGSLIYEGGIMATINNQYAFNSLLGVESSSGDFYSITNLSGKQNEAGTIEATKSVGSTDYIFQIEHKYSTPVADLAAARAELKFINKGVAQISNPAIGFLFDWDLAPETSNNYTAIFPEAIPSNFANNAQKAAAQIAWNKDNNIYVGSLVWSDENDAVAQAAGLNYGIIHSSFGFEEKDQIKALNSKLSWQNTGKNDINYVVGMQFDNTINTGENRTCTVCTGFANSKEKLALFLKKCYDTNFVSVNDNDIQIRDIEVYPNPAKDYFNIDMQNDYIGNVNIEVINLIGQSVINFEFDKVDRFCSKMINISELNNSSYIVKICYGNKYQLIKLMK